MLLQLVVPPARVSDLKCTQMRTETGIPSDPLRKGNRRGRGRKYNSPDKQIPLVWTSKINDSKSSGMATAPKAMSIHLPGTRFDTKVIVQWPHQGLEKMKLVWKSLILFAAWVSLSSYLFKKSRWLWDQGKSTGLGVWNLSWL